MTYSRCDHLLAHIQVSAVRPPDHKPAGEIRVTDPDGHVLLIDQRSPAP